MGYDGRPWFIGINGVEHSAELARTETYAANNGLSGVIGATDFKVSQTPTPGTSIQYLPGAVAMVSLYPGCAGQSYLGRAGTLGTLPVVATGSGGGRHDLVIARIRDPQYGTYAGFNALSPNVGFDYFRVEIVQGVANGATSIPGATYPHVVLARLEIPASTGTITDAMIKDLRQKTKSNWSQIIRVVTPDADFNMNKSVYSYWPLVGGSNQTIRVPQWANKLHVRVDMPGIEITNAGNAAGLRGVLGGGLIDNQYTTIHTNIAGRLTHTHVSQFTIPENWRGIDLVFGVQALHSVGTGYIQCDYQTTVNYTFTFSESVE